LDKKRGHPITVAEQLNTLAGIILPKIEARLTEDTDATSILTQFQKNPLSELPDIKHNYVLEFALQLSQMQKDPDWFIQSNSIGDDEVNAL